MDSSEYPQLGRGLFEHGGPAIRYRTAAELMDRETGIDLPQLAEELLASPSVTRWLERLRPETGFMQLHSSKPTAFENAMGKLTQLGCRAGMAPL